MGTEGQPKWSKMAFLVLEEALSGSMKSDVVEQRTLYSNVLVYHGLSTIVGTQKMSESVAPIKRPIRYI